MSDGERALCGRTLCGRTLHWCQPDPVALWPCGLVALWWRGTAAASCPTPPHLLPRCRAGPQAQRGAAGAWALPGEGLPETAPSGAVCALGFTRGTEQQPPEWMR